MALSVAAIMIITLPGHRGLRIADRADQPLAPRQTHPGSVLQQLIDSAIDAHAKSLVIPPGDYLFNDTAAFGDGLGAPSVIGAHDLNITATNVTVWLYPGGFVNVRDSAHISIIGLTVDFDPPCFSQGQVTAVHDSNHSFELAVEPGFLPPNLRLYPQFNATEVKVIYWDSKTRQLLPQPGANPWNPDASQCSGTACKIVLGSRSAPLPKVGGLVTLSPRIGATMDIRTWYSSAYRLTNCTAVTSREVMLHGAGSMGWGEFGGEGGHVYAGCRNVRRPNSNHLLSSNHDGFHSYAVAHGPTLDSVEIGYCGDDALNIHSVFSVVLREQLDASSLYIIDTGLPGAFSFNGRVGDVASFFSIQTVQPLGNVTISSVNLVDDPTIVAAAVSAMHNANAQCAGGCGIFNCSGVCGFYWGVNAVWEVQFDSTPPSGVSNFALVQVKGRSAGGATIRGSHFHDAYDGVMQLRSSRATVSDNLFERAHGMKVSTAKAWFEGAAELENIVVDSNVFVDCCTGHGCNPISFHDCPTCAAKNNSIAPASRR
eukprot:m.467932 g.467932  ORF g.467932 m.467932 type:complete len:541 (-) comp27068_c0_seq1:65-1687(-)